MRIKNVSKGLIVLSIKDGKGYRSILISAGKIVEDEAIKQSDVDIYIKEKSLEVLASNDNINTNPVILPNEVTAETLKDLSIDDLKKWCKDNKVKGYSKLKEDELITLILDTLAALKNIGEGEA